MRVGAFAFARGRVALSPRACLHPQNATSVSPFTHPNCPSLPPMGLAHHICSILSTPPSFPLQGHEAALSALLACPRVDPNLPARGAPPVAIAAHRGRLPALALLLRDPRTNPNQATAQVCQKKKEEEKQSRTHARTRKARWRGRAALVISTRPLFAVCLL
jgi:hypothetical protein